MWRHDGGSSRRRDLAVRDLRDAHRRRAAPRVTLHAPARSPNPRRVPADVTLVDRGTAAEPLRRARRMLEPVAGAQGHPSRRKEVFTLARSAYAALIADRNVTSSGQEERVGAQLGRGAPGGSRRIERVARAVRRLHEGPPFPKGPSTAGVVRLFNETLRARGMAGLPAVIVSTLEETERVMQRFAATAPCHNDLNPGNILETEEALYLVDWDTATQGDPFFDLGELGVFAFPTAPQRGELLEAYLGRSPSEEERARATLARGMALGFYAAAFVCASTMRGGTARVADEGTAMPGPELLRALAEGRVGLEGVAASLMGEMRREMERQEWVEAKRALDAS